MLADSLCDTREISTTLSITYLLVCGKAGALELEEPTRLERCGAHMCALTHPGAVHQCMRLTGVCCTRQVLKLLSGACRRACRRAAVHRCGGEADADGRAHRWAGALLCRPRERRAERGDPDAGRAGGQLLRVHAQAVAAVRQAAAVLPQVWHSILTVYLAMPCASCTTLGLQGYQVSPNSRVGLKLRCPERCRFGLPGMQIALTAVSRQ